MNYNLSDYYFDESAVYDRGIFIPPITAYCHTQYNPPNTSFVDRYFTRFYKRFEDRPDEDHLILFHSNRICLVGLAPSHIALRKGIKSINFDIGNHDRRNNKVSGKGKRGGMNLQPTTALAIVTCTDDSEYTIVSCITAKLIEVNESLIKQTDKMAIEGDGHVAVMFPKIDNCDPIKESLLTQMQYEMLNRANMIL